MRCSRAGMRWRTHERQLQNLRQVQAEVPAARRCREGSPVRVRGVLGSYYAAGVRQDQDNGTQMRLGTTIRYALARLLLKASALPVAPAWLKVSFLNPSFRSLVSEGYAKNAVVFACISALAFDFPEPPLLVYPDESDDAEAIAKHPLRLLLKQPNPIMGEAEMMAYTIAYMALGGNAYWHKVRDAGRRVKWIFPYHAGQISPVPGGDTWIERYDFDDGSGRLSSIPADDIVHLKWPSPDPKQPWMAQPPLLAAAREVDTDNETTRYLFALMKNDAVPRGAVEMPENSALSEGEWRRMKAQWHERYGGDARGDIAILEGGAKYNRIGLNLEELALDRKSTRLN